MASEITKLKPALLWKYFDRICAIPHGSKDEKRIGEFLLNTAKEHNCRARQDDAGNVVIEVPATPGHENAPIVVLQGHMDMVCEKNSDTVHDFSKDPVTPVIEGDWVTADGTTLGADNGIGLAAGLAFLEDNQHPHGPLELLCTVDEETGLNGAMALQPGFVKGKILLNLDSEEEGCFSIGCAGGGDTQVTLPLKRKAAAAGTSYTIKLSGFRGGHSGIDINTGRGNAVRLLARILRDLDTPFSLSAISGGTKHNAIPREAFAAVTVDDDSCDAFRKEMQQRFEEVRFEYKAVEKDAALSLTEAKSEFPCLEPVSRDLLLNLLTAIPHGVQAMNMEMKGLVETSTNMAITTTMAGKATIYSSTRSSIPSALEAVRRTIGACAALAGASVEYMVGYPAWTPNLDSPLLTTVKAAYKRLSGKDPDVIAIHAGLECGIIGEKYPGMDMISIGPDLQNPHSPDERVGISSVGRFWELVTEVLKDLA
ncbi:aminoacyl-histidine dipeptidase [bacterium]|nr:aminoacyl-histidine dipeptidase [bacterium]